MLPIILDGHKLAWHKERVDALLHGERVAPITIDCALTRRCTYRCVYCYSQLQENPGPELTREAIFRFLDDAAEIGVKAVSLVSDGESTCSPHLLQAVLHGRANGLDMALGTNGWLLEDDRLEQILPALTYLRFNITAGAAPRYAQIHGCAEKCFDKVCRTIRKAVRIKAAQNLAVTVGLQMVLLPEFKDQILPLARLGRDLGADYLVIKHCSDDEQGRLGVNYAGYADLEEMLREAEALSGDRYLVRVKWSKIKSRGKRDYSRCYGPPLILQTSGSGLVAPCGMLFNKRYAKYHIGNIAVTRFRELFHGKRYWEVMDSIASPLFDARRMCGSLCLQHKVNECLWHLKNNGVTIDPPGSEPPLHKNFI